MSIHNVKQVMVLSQDVVHLVGEEKWGVNEYLAEGWILLNVHSVSEDSDNGPTQHSEYTLGWPRDEKPPSDEHKRLRTERGLEEWKRIRERLQFVEEPPK